METSTMGPYLKIIAWGSVVGVLFASIALNVWYLTFSLRYSTETFWSAVGWGAALALVTSVFVLIGTIGFARQLGSRRGKLLFILFSFISPVIGWLIVGVIMGVVVTWDFFFGYPLIAAVSSALAGVTACIATLFLPRSSDSVNAEGDADKAFDLFHGGTH